MRPVQEQRDQNSVTSASVFHERSTMVRDRRTALQRYGPQNFCSVTPPVELPLGTADPPNPCGRPQQPLQLDERRVSSSLVDCVAHTSHLLRLEPTDEFSPPSWLLKFRQEGRTSSATATRHLKPHSRSRPSTPGHLTRLPRS